MNNTQALPLILIICDISNVVIAEAGHCDVPEPGVNILQIFLLQIFNFYVSY